MNQQNITDLLNIHMLQIMQDTFSEYIGIALYITDKNGKPLTKQSGGCKLCESQMKENHIGCKFCEFCVADGLKLACTKQKAIVYTCHAGLMECVVPIILDNNCIGYLIGGQVKNVEFNERLCKKISIKYDMDYNDYKEAWEKVKLMEQEKFERLAVFLEHVAKDISLLAQQQDTRKIVFEGCRMFSESCSVISE